MHEHYQFDSLSCDNTVALTSGQLIFIKGQKWESLLGLGKGFHVAARAEKLRPAALN